MPPEAELQFLPLAKRRTTPVECLLSRHGYASKISAHERPEATKPTIVPTVMRIFRKHGLPPIMSGFRVTRSICEPSTFLPLAWRDEAARLNSTPLSSAQSKPTASPLAPALENPVAGGDRSPDPIWLLDG